MSPEELKQIAEKLRKLEWLECVHSTFVNEEKANKALQSEFLDTRRLRLLCEEKPNSANWWQSTVKSQSRKQTPE